MLALLIPLAVLPAVALGVDEAWVGALSARLQESTMEAAIAASQALDAPSLRAGAPAALSPSGAAAAVRRSLAASDPGARVERVQVSGLSVTVEAYLLRPNPFGLLLGDGVVRLSARASAALVVGFSAPL